MCSMHHVEQGSNLLRALKLRHAGCLSSCSSTGAVPAAAASTVCTAQGARAGALAHGRPAQAALAVP